MITFAKKPFPHLVWDDFYPEAFATYLFWQADAFFEEEKKAFLHYDSPFERGKFTNRDSFGDEIVSHFCFMYQPLMLQRLEDAFRINGLKEDASLHGGGLHISVPGGKLDVHLDYNIHPVTGQQRRLSAILYLNPVWKEEWGGGLELWNSDMTACHAVIPPKFNRLVVFENTEHSFHGHPDPLKCPEDVVRISLANFYLTDPVPGAVPRKRALFVPRPGDATSPELEAARKARAE